MKGNDQKIHGWLLWYYKKNMRSVVYICIQTTFFHKTQSNQKPPNEYIHDMCVI